jgi:hypothetical protein
MAVRVTREGQAFFMAEVQGFSPLWAVLNQDYGEPFPLAEESFFRLGKAVFKVHKIVTKPSVFPVEPEIPHE